MIVHYADPDLNGILLAFLHRRSSGAPVRLMLAEGDSWFSFGGGTGNLLMALDNADILIVTCASPGDTVRNMARLGNEPFRLMLSPMWGVRWDAVLLSAGGNDLLADVGKLIVSGRLDRDLLTHAVAEIERSYHRLVAAVRQHHSCPIHAHSYDYPVSDPHGGWLRFGPWVGNTLLAADIPPRRHDAIIADIIDALAARLRSIQDITLHDTRGTLNPGRWRWIGWQADWRNEIHPSTSGYRKLAQRWNLAITE